jgi:hypothetical protein
VLVFVGLAVVMTPSLCYLFFTGDNSVNNDNIDDKGVNLPEKEKVPGQEQVPGEEKPGEDKEEIISATIDLHPHKLNCKSKGCWVTVFIGLPLPYQTADINISTILLNDILAPKEYPHAIVDIDGDDIPELMVKFCRCALIAILDHQQFCEITITGQLSDVITFQGSCVIELIHFS